SVITSAIIDKSSGDATQVAVMSDEAAQFTELDSPMIEVIEAGSRDSATEWVESGEADAAVFASGTSPTGVELVAQDSVPEILGALFTAHPEVTLLDPEASDEFDVMAYFLALAFGLLFFITA